jgi:hypothetical protein
MGNLIIRKVTYSGDNYSFESPELQDGINIIEGDNGSGKSTFSYFIAYGLGDNVKPFDQDNKTNRYDEITKDTNNYVTLDIEINSEKYKLKRFIGLNDIFVSDGENVEKYPIYRHKEHAPNIFSDWLLGKLEITQFEVNLGTIQWTFNFMDLFRLLYYDQDTEPSKIYKSPSFKDNFVTDSIIIRKTIFEVLLGISSIEYFQKMNEMKVAEKLKHEAKGRLDGFLALHTDINFKEGLDNTSIINEYEEQLAKLKKQRDLYSKDNSMVNEKVLHLSTLQSELINTELDISNNRIKIQGINTEIYNIEKMYKSLENEISDIKKTIFTHEQLNLFSMQVCPFCMNSKKERKDGYCICGEKFNENGYEKFVYNSSEYKRILQHKEKSLKTIEIALNSYYEEIDKLNKDMSQKQNDAIEQKDELSKAINSIEFSGNSQFIDSINDKILEVKSSILDEKRKEGIISTYTTLNSTFNTKNLEYEKKVKDFQKAQSIFETNNAKTIAEFNIIYNQLMQKSSCKKCEKAEINEDYMPVINDGNYINKSADVPKRLMYYFTILSLSLKLKNVRHPRFLLIDTPETVGIDDDNLKNDLGELDLALSLSKEEESASNPPYQVILTTGVGKYPSKYENKILLRFNTQEDSYILESKH